jgi:hypothetical protein
MLIQTEKGAGVFTRNVAGARHKPRQIKAINVPQSQTSKHIGIRPAECRAVFIKQWSITF